MFGRGGEIVNLLETTPITDPVTEQIALLPNGIPATGPRSSRKVHPRRINSDEPTVRLDGTSAGLPENPVARQSAEP
ncbi:hypothetical protein JMUB6875_36890 [Nocardia sp. JMUB6875]